MKVILLKDVRGVGQRHEVKEVADGYAINALFPQKAAEPATPDKIAHIEAQRAAHDADVAKLEDQMANKVRSLNGAQVTISSRATPKGGLFKALSPKDVAAAIRAQHALEIPESSIQLRDPIKTTGEHTVGLFSKAAKASLTVTVKAA
jgi:large subunit ribosomal protein L9